MQKTQEIKESYAYTFNIVADKSVDSLFKGQNDIHWLQILMLRRFVFHSISLLFVEWYKTSITLFSSSASIYTLIHTSQAVCVFFSLSLTLLGVGVCNFTVSFHMQTLYKRRLPFSEWILQSIRCKFWFASPSYFRFISTWNQHNSDNCIFFFIFSSHCLGSGKNVGWWYDRCYHAPVNK